MADDEPVKQTIKKRRNFRPPRLKSLLRMGISTPSLDETNGALSAKGEWAALSNGMRADQMICPVCDKRLKLLDVIDDTGEEETPLKLVGGPTTGNVIRSLGCDCGYTLPVEDLLKDVRAEAQSVKSAETQYYIFGCLTVAFFAGVSYFNGSGTTLLGGLILGLVLIVRGVLFRFRQWQLADPDSRMFQDQTQFWAWIKHELSN